MSNLELIERLCTMLDEAQDIIRKQAVLLDEHGIKTDGKPLEEQRQRLLDEIERTC